MLRDYLEKIQNSEGLHGKVGEEKEREILIKYFNSYTFGSREEAIRFFIAWDIIQNPIEAEPVLAYCAKALGDKYNLKATMTGLLLELEPRGKVFSYKDG